VVDNDIEILKHLKKLEKTLPKIHKKKITLLKKRKINLIARIQVYSIICLATLFIFFTVLPPFYWPVNTHVTSEFLFRLKPDSIQKGLEIHHGIDLGAPTGTVLHPSSIGIVTKISYSSILGNYIIVDHLLGFSTLYAHLQKVNTHIGSIVFPGISNIGFVGNTGRSTGSHLHFSIRIFNIALPPRLFLVFHSLRKMVFKF
jgi:murein DD-endopeptidase MepM/ murein hydrolase activator NlpD